MERTTAETKGSIMLSALTIIGCLLVVGLFLDAFLLKGQFIGELLIGAAVYLLLNAVYGIWWITQHLCY